MAAKSTNVIARVEPEIKEQAERILAEMGISTSTAINMFYRQIILSNGLPFRPSRRPLSREEMTDEEFNARMAIGLAQAMANDSSPVEEAFERISRELENVRKIQSQDDTTRGTIGT